MNKEVEDPSCNCEECYNKLQEKRNFIKSFLQSYQ